MSGKAVLIVVIGFTMIFLVMGYFWGNLATRTVDNHVSYYKSTIAHNIAVSGANIGLSEYTRDTTWYQTGHFIRPFENIGEMDVSFDAPLGPSTRTLISDGSFMGVESIVKVKLSRATKLLAEYAWFIPQTSAANSARGWITGDTVFGAFHSNQWLVVDGNPVFTGKVTTSNGIKDQSKKPSPKSNPEFLGGFEKDVDVTWNFDMDFSAQAAAASVDGLSFPQNKNLWLTFYSNGTFTYRTAAKSAGDDSSKYSTASAPIQISSLTNKIIYQEKGDIYMSGVLNGEMTVIAHGSSGGIGNVYLVGDMVYETDPMIPNGSGGYMINPAADDMMGIVATNNIYVATSQVSGGKANNVTNPDIHVDAAIFCVQGGFQVEDFNDFVSGQTGTIYLQGSMTAGKEEDVSVLSGNTIVKGYKRHVIFDSRFAFGPPTWFPYVTYYKVVSWLE